jgi:two-component system, chemotaxis family, sensor kinase CheA
MPSDPYKYFRLEAQELLDQLGRGALELEKGVPAPDAVARLLRLAHTLKGAAGVVRQREISDRSHALEDVLTLDRDSTSPVPRDRIDLVLTLLDEIGSRIALLAPPPNTETVAPDQLDPPVLGFRPAVDDLDALLGGVVEAHIQLGVLRPRLEQVKHARHAVDLVVDQLARPRGPEAVHMGHRTPNDKARSMVEELRGVFSTLERGLGDDIDQIDRELRQVREAAERLRLAPASALFTFLERAVREVARTLGKRVAFTAYGGDVRVDTFVLNIIQSALLQIVRNAVAHGIEAGDDGRLAAGKPAEGVIALRVSQRGSWVSFACTDDGRGIDFAAVQRVAQRKGLSIENGPTVQPDELLRLLLKGGMSTSGAVTNASGRGIGLDVVREAAERLGGEATMRTDAGKGTTVELLVPVSITSLHTLMVETSGTTAAIPLDAVCGTARMTREEIVRTEQGESVVYEGQAIPLYSPRLAAFSTPASTRSSKHSSAVIVRGRTGIAALRVDRILGTADVVMRPLPKLAPAAGIVAGAVLDAVGDPQLVLHADGIVAQAQRGGTVEGEAAPTRLSVLVVDDSLTTRMLEQSILESAGFDVDMATSGEEGLAKARSARYALFLVDVEMPGMDGFTFIERTRADPALRDIPSILVTSRNSPEDRQRGQDVGAQAYVVKSEFDQGVLLERIRTLVG